MKYTIEIETVSNGYIVRGENGQVFICTTWKEVEEVIAMLIKQADFKKK